MLLMFKMELLFQLIFILISCHGKCKHENLVNVARLYFNEPMRSEVMWHSLHSTPSFSTLILSSLYLVTMLCHHIFASRNPQIVLSSSPLGWRTTQIIMWSIQSRCSLKAFDSFFPLYYWNVFVHLWICSSLSWRRWSYQDYSGDNWM